MFIFRLKIRRYSSANLQFETRCMVACIFHSFFRNPIKSKRQVKANANHQLEKVLNYRKLYMKISKWPRMIKNNNG